MPRLQCGRGTPCPAFPGHGVSGLHFFSSLPSRSRPETSRDDISSPKTKCRLPSSPASALRRIARAHFGLSCSPAPAREPTGWPAPPAVRDADPHGQRIARQSLETRAFSDRQDLHSPGAGARLTNLHWAIATSFVIAESPQFSIVGPRSACHVLLLKSRAGDGGPVVDRQRRIPATEQRFLTPFLTRTGMDVWSRLPAGK